ncbi:MAG: glycoside hydrolase family 36 protein [Candidatus Hodarchaeota archaeon]
MIKINNEKDIHFEISNGIIRLKFFKNGENKGKFEINFIKNESIECCIEDCYSVLNFFYPNKEELLEIPSYNYNFKHRVEKVNNIIGKGLKVTFESENNDSAISFNIQFLLYEKKDFIQVKLINIKDNSQNPLSIHSISPLTIKDSALWLSGSINKTDLDNITWFKQGWQSWSPCKLIIGTEIDDEGPKIDVFKRTFDNQDYKIKGRFYSEFCTVITDLVSKNSLILGFTTLNTQFTRIILNYKDKNVLNSLTAFGCMDGIHLQKSDINFSEELFICFKTQNQGYYGLIEYAKLVKSNNNIKISEPIPIGWCSWYYYFTDITQKDMIKNIEFFNENRDFPIDFIQLDDGYFTYIGDFNDVNSKFSNSLKPIFKKINSYGFKSGIWTAPFFAEKRANLFKKHRHWFLNDKESKRLLKVHYGGSWNVYLYGLDLSNLKVLDYLHDFYSNLLYLNELKHNNSKIYFFKIDFLHAAVPIEGNFYNKNLTRAQILYNGVKTIKSAITHDSFLLGCGAPLGPCVGLVDAMRIGEDTAPKWEETNKNLLESGIHTPSLKVSLINIIYRSFMHRYFWINDPDCLMIRRSNTELNLDEIKLQLTIMGLSGGQILISDDMTKLSEEEINEAKLLIPPYNPKENNPIVVDAFISEMPSIYLVETHEIIGKRFLVAIINWNDKKILKTVKIPEIIPNLSDMDKTFYIYDFWNENYLGEYKTHDNIDLGEIKPHCCLYLTIIPVNKKSEEIPVIISSNLHISQGCNEIKKFEVNPKLDKLIIYIELKGTRQGFIILKLPKNRKIIKSNFTHINLNPKDNLWKVFIQFKDFIELKIDLD